MSRELRAAHQEYRRYLPLFGECLLQQEFGCIEEVSCADNTGCTELLRERSRSEMSSSAGNVPLERCSERISRCRVLP